MLTGLSLFQYNIRKCHFQKYFMNILHSPSYIFDKREYSITAFIFNVKKLMFPFDSVPFPKLNWPWTRNSYS